MQAMEGSVTVEDYAAALYRQLPPEDKYAIIDALKEMGRLEILTGSSLLPQVPARSVA